MKIPMDMDVSYLQMRGDVFLTDVLQAATVAFGLSRSACVSSVQYQPVVSLRAKLRCESFGQVALYGLYRCTFRQSDAARNPEYMRVYGDYGFVVYD